MKIHEIKDNFDLVNSVDLEMTPEEAIALHLEWGPLRSQAVSYTHLTLPTIYSV